MDASSISASPVFPSDSGFPENAPTDLAVKTDVLPPPKPTKELTARQVALAKHNAAKKYTVEYEERQEKPRRALRDAINKLKTLVAGEATSPWRIGEEILSFERMKLNPLMQPLMAKLFPKNCSKITRKEIIGLICSWSDDSKTEAKKYYDYTDVAGEFPVEFMGINVRCGKLTFTAHSEVLRAIRKLKKKKWLVAWNEGGDAIPRRRDFLQLVSEKKKEANVAKMQFGRPAIEKLVSESNYCCRDHRGQPLTEKKIKSTNKSAVSTQTQPNSNDGGLNFWQVDGLNEDRLCYVVSITENDAKALMVGHGVDASKVTLKFLGRLHINAGVYDLRRVEQIETQKTDNIEQKEAAHA